MCPSKEEVDVAFASIGKGFSQQQQPQSRDSPQEKISFKDRNKIAQLLYPENMSSFIAKSSTIKALKINFLVAIQELGTALMPRAGREAQRI